jgi:hypothetical protein
MYKYLRERLKELMRTYGGNKGDGHEQNELISYFREWG